MARLTWDTLSVDIKALIIDEVLRPTDLRNVCLVNKQCHELAVKPLYRYIELDIGGKADGRLTACFSPGNIGVHHIRSMLLFCVDEYDRSMVEQAHLVMRMILELLPPNVLERFSWRPWGPFKVDNLLLLYRRQQKLQSIEVTRLDRPFLPCLKNDEKLVGSIFSTAKKLFLYMEDRASISLAGFFVKTMASQLEELTICSHSKLNASNDINPRELHDSATGPGLMTRTIFAQQLPFDACEPLAKLTSLDLNRINVRYAADTWCRVIDFKKLSSLRIYQCSGADALLGQLCKAAHLPATLKTFTLEHKDSEENETLLALDGFLCLVSGIHDLCIDLKHAKELPSKVGIARHGKTLETLTVHAWKDESPASTLPSSSSSIPPGEGLVYKHQDLEIICTACANLTQLSLAWPPHFINRPAPGDLHLFETTISHRLRKLVTLHISSWPSNGADLPRDIYETLLQASALRIFNTAAYYTSLPPPASSTIPNDNENNTTTPVSGLTAASISDFPFTTAHTPTLRLIAYGVSDRTYERLEPETQIIYLRSTSVDAEGRTKLHAAPIGWCLKSFIEPLCSVLNSGLLRMPKPPFPCSDEE